MSMRSQVALLGAVFVLGGLGGAAVLTLTSRHESSSSKHANKARSAEATDGDGDGDESSIELDELRAALFKLGVPTSDEEAQASTSSEEVASRDVAPRDDGRGIPLSAVLGKLEHDYQASKAEEQTSPASVDPPAPTATPVTAAPPISEPRIALAEQQEPRQPAPQQAAPAPHQAQAEPQRVAVLQGNDIEQVNVNPGTVNVTNVTETTTNQIAISAGYPYPVTYWGGVYPNGVYPNGVVYPNQGYYPAPGRVRPSAPHGGFAGRPGPVRASDSPMFPADASVSLGPIYDGRPFGSYR